MTPLVRDSLKWFAARGPVGWFDRSAPTEAMRNKLLRSGLIEELKPEVVGLIKYQITPAGRAALMQEVK